jgi:hypothetical protein
MTVLRAILADLLLAFAALCDRIDTALADSCNGPEDET